MHVQLFVYLSVCLSVCQSVCLSVFLSVCPSVCLSVCVSVYAYMCTCVMSCHVMYICRYGSMQVCMYRYVRTQQPLFKYIGMVSLNTSSENHPFHSGFGGMLALHESMASCEMHIHVDRIYAHLYIIIVYHILNMFVKYKHLCPCLYQDGDSVLYHDYATCFTSSYPF